MKKIFFIIIFGLLSQITYSYSQYVESNIEVQVSTAIYSFQENKEAIKLKPVKTFYNDTTCTLDLKVSYIIEIAKSMSDKPCLLFIDLLDKEGFQLKSCYLDRLDANFTGTIRGEFSVSFDIYRQFDDVVLMIRCD